MNRTSTWWSTLLVLATCALAQAQDPPTGWEAGDVRAATHLEATETAPPSWTEGRYQLHREHNTDNLRTLRDGRRLGHLEAATYAPLRSERRGAAIYEGAFESNLGSLEAVGLGAEAEAELGQGSFRWQDPDGSTRTINGAAVRAGVRADAVRVKGETSALVIPSGLGRFDAQLKGEASVNARAEALGVISAGAEGLELTGVGVVGAFAEAGLALPLGVDLLGVKTRVETRAAAYVGAGLKGALEVKLDPASGRLRISSDVGAVLGGGAGVGVSVDVDARQLLTWLGITPRDPAAVAAGPAPPATPAPAPAPGTPAPGTPAASTPDLGGFGEFELDDLATLEALDRELRAEADAAPRDLLSESPSAPLGMAGSLEEALSAH